MTESPTHLLIVDDDPSIRAALAERFEARGYAVSCAGDGARALELARARPDVVLLDLQLPELSGIRVLRAMRAEGIDAAVVVITAYGTVRRAVDAMAAGACDFIEKPFRGAVVESAVARAAAERRPSRSAPDLIVADPAMRSVVDVARKAAQSASTVLVLGESGVGKEVLARHVHAWSPRAAGPFVALSCVALAETLLESELFGHEAGAFTGATARKPGKVELADGGTLFLDEIGDISPAFQAKLLRFLQERTFERVGATETRRVDVRVVAATNRDLRAAVAEGSFREDLYYRLDVISVTVPPLRERPDDVESLAHHFAAVCGAPEPVFAPGAMAALRAHDWPGNVRELRNSIERAVALSDGSELGAAELISRRRPLARGSRGFHAAVESYRRDILRTALARTGGNQTRAAEALGLSRTYLARLIRRYGLGRSSATATSDAE